MEYSGQDKPLKFTKEISKQKFLKKNPDKNLDPKDPEYARIFRENVLNRMLDPQLIERIECHSENYKTDKYISRLDKINKEVFEHHGKELFNANIKKTIDTYLDDIISMHIKTQSVNKNTNKFIIIQDRLDTPSELNPDNDYILNFMKKNKHITNTDLIINVNNLLYSFYYVQNKNFNLYNYHEKIKEYANLQNIKTINDYIKFQGRAYDRDLSDNKTPFKDLTEVEKIFKILHFSKKKHFYYW